MRKGVWRWEEYARRPALPSGAATASRSKPGRLAYYRVGKGISLRMKALQFTPWKAGRFPY